MRLPLTSVVLGLLEKEKMIRFELPNFYQVKVSVHTVHKKTYPRVQRELPAQGVEEAGPRAAAARVWARSLALPRGSRVRWRPRATWGRSPLPLRPCLQRSVKQVQYEYMFT